MRGGIRSRKNVAPTQSQFDWIYGEGPITHDGINQFLEFDSGTISHEAYVEAAKRLYATIEVSEQRSDHNHDQLNQQRITQKQLLGAKKALQKEINELVSINDDDRETIIQQTKQLDTVKAQAKKMKKAMANSKPGEEVEFESKFSPTQ